MRNAERKIVTTTIEAAPHISKKNAEILDAAFRLIQKKHGKCSAKLVVQEARKETTQIGQLLHSFFPWDDKKAAEIARLKIAGELIRSVRIMVSVDNAPPRSVRAWVNTVDAKHGHSFKQILFVMSAKDSRKQLLVEAKRELAAFKKRYETLEELSSLLQQIGDFLERRI